MSKKYYLGLDIGTNSVGWAVTDENYNLCKYAGKRMWGIRLFEGGETAEQRRISRSNRRRLSRKKQRIDLLQSKHYGLFSFDFHFHYTSSSLYNLYCWEKHF